MGRKRGLSVVLPSVNHLSRSVHAGRDFPSLAVGDERCRTDGAWKGNGAVRASDEIIDGNDAIMSEISDEELQADIREDGAESK